MFALPSFVGMFRIRAPNAEAIHPPFPQHHFTVASGIPVNNLNGAGSGVQLDEFGRSSGLLLWSINYNRSFSLYFILRLNLLTPLRSLAQIII
jgi:hypothetical protein